MTLFKILSAISSSCGYVLIYETLSDSIQLQNILSPLIDIQIKLQNLVLPYGYRCISCWSSTLFRCMPLRLISTAARKAAMR